MPALAAAALLAFVPILACPEPIAATPTAAAMGADEAFAGLVLGDSVNVRSGPGSAYDVVAKLQGGARVAVLGEAFGWLLVRPDAEIRVYVSRDLVEPKGDGVAVVRRDRVNLRSKPSADATVVGQASHGDLVRLLEDGGDFATIAAPPEACFYVHRDLVRRLAPAEAGAALRASAPQAAPATPARSSAVEPPALAGPSLPSAAEKVARARELYLAELDKKEIGAMGFAAAERLFAEAAREATGEDVRAAAQAGLKRLRFAARLQEDYRRRLAPVERLVDGEREPCRPPK